MARAKFELSQLRSFVAVAEELSFRRAAERLHMTQPPLSRQIQLLEHGIGLTLFDRNNRTVRLTSAGESLLTSATDLLERAEYAVLTARQAERGEVGSVAMGFVPSAAMEFVPRIVDMLSARLPAVTFRATEMMSYEIVEALLSGRLDLGLTRLSGRSREIESRRVVSETFVLALPAGHWLTTAERPTLADLDRQDYIAYSTERGGFLREIHLGLFAATGVTPRIVQEVSQTHTVLALVNRGIGLALVPNSSRSLRMEHLVYREIDVPGEFRSDLYLAVGPKRRSLLHTRVQEAILEALGDFADDR
jgi:DNA-binding transcriptional LysR family regulator